MVFKDSDRPLVWGQTSGSISKTSDVRPQHGLMVSDETIGFRSPSIANLETFQGNSVHELSTQSSRVYKTQSEALAVVTTESTDQTAHKIDRLAGQNAQLRIKLKTLRTERDNNRNALEQMLSELIATQTSLEEKQSVIAQNADELSALRTEIQKMKIEETALVQRERGLRTLQEEVSRLTNKDKDENTVSIDKDELYNLRRISSRLLKELEQKDERLRQQETKLKEWDMGWEVKLQDTREQLQAEFCHKFENSQSMAMEQQLRCEEAEERVRELEARQIKFDEQEERVRAAESTAAATHSNAEFQKSQAATYLQQLTELRDSHAALSQTIQENSKSKVDAQALEELKALHAAELEEARRVSNFFKTNSEQLSRKNRETMAANRSLEEALHGKTRETEEQSSLIEALKLQIGELPRHPRAQ